MIMNGTVLGDSISLIGGWQDISKNLIEGDSIWYGSGKLAGKTVRLGINDRTKYQVNTEHVNIRITGYIEYYGYTGTGTGKLESSICAEEIPSSSPYYERCAYYERTSDIKASKHSTIDGYYNLVLGSSYVLKSRYLSEIEIDAKCIEPDLYLDLYIESVYLIQ